MILEKLGQDEFAYVYNAFDKNSKEFVALKVFRQKNLEEYENEKTILETINDNNGKETTNEADESKVIKLLKVDKIEDNLILFLEAGATNLDSVLQLREKYRENEIFYILNDLMENLSVLKTKEICHGNIKLANVVLFPKKCGNTSKNNNFSYKLINYSISHQYRKPLLGMTRLYASPDLQSAFQSPKELDYLQTDMYALGILCLKLMGLNNDSLEKIKKNDLTLLEEQKEKYPNLINFVKEMLGLFNLQWETFKTRINEQNSEAPLERLFVQSIKFQQIQKFDEKLCEKYVKIYHNTNQESLARKYIKVLMKGQISEEEEDKYYDKIVIDAKNLDYYDSFENPSEFINDNDSEATIMKKNVQNKITTRELAQDEDNLEESLDLRRDKKKTKLLE